MSINKYIALVTALLVNLSSGYLWAGAGDTENIKKATALLNKLDFANISSYPYLSHPINVIGEKNSGETIPELYLYKHNIHSIVEEGIRNGVLDGDYGDKNRVWKIRELMALSEPTPDVNKSSMKDYYNYFTGRDEYYVLEGGAIDKNKIIQKLVLDIEAGNWDVDKIKKIIERFVNEGNNLYINDLMFIVSNDLDKTYVTSVIGMAQFNVESGVNIHMSKGGLDIKTLIHELIHIDIESGAANMPGVAPMNLVSYVWDDKLGAAKSIQALLNSSLKKNEWWSALSQSDWESHYAFGNDSDIEGINEFLEEFLVRVMVRSLYYNNLNSAGSIIGEVGGEIVKIKPMYAKLNNVINSYFAIESN